MEKAEVTTWFVDGQWFKHFLEISKLKEAVGTDTIFKYSMQRSERIDLFPLSVWKIEWFFQIHKGMKLHVWWRAKGYSKDKVIYNNWLWWNMQQKTWGKI